MHSSEYEALSKLTKLLTCVIPSRGIQHVTSPYLTKLTVLQQHLSGHLERLQAFTSLRQLTLVEYASDPGDLALLAKIPNLRSLAIKAPYLGRLGDLEPFTQLEELEIQHLDLTNLPKIAEVTSLKSLSFYTLPPHKDSGKGYDFRPFSHLTSLQIHSGGSLIGLAAGLAQLSHFPHLEKLSLLCSGDDGWIFSAIASTSLRKLSVCDYNSSRTCCLPEHEWKMPNLVELQLQNISLLHNIKFLVSGNPPLTRLVLRDCGRLDDKTWSLIATLPLRVLKILTCEIVGDSSLQILSAIPTLASLQLAQIASKSFFTISGVQHLTQCPNLQTLEITTFHQDITINLENVRTVFKAKPFVCVMVNQV